MLKKYRMEMRAEKKIIVGKAWKARIKPSEVSPVGSVCPGARANLPNTNFAPAQAGSRTFITRSLRNKNNFEPTGTTKTKKANNNCKTVPQIMTFQFIFFLSLDSSQAKPIRTNIPEKLTRLKISISSSLKSSIIYGFV
jgi:hypothetical protein